MTKNKKCTRYFSSKQEQAVAKIVGGRLVPNSGAGSFAKGDLATAFTLFECKTSMKPVNSFSIKKEVLEKLQKEAFSMNKLFSCLVFNFEEDGENYFVISEKQMRNILNNLPGNLI